jgi:pimeloyl-ACP methyl ester carboxylesterase
VVRELSADFRIFAYDQRGHGLSASPRSRAAYSTLALADDLEAVMTAVLRADERAVVAGHSMGGMTIMAASGREAVRRRTAAVLLASTGSSRLAGSAQVTPPLLSARWLRRILHRRMLVSRMPLGPVTRVSKAALRYGVLSPSATPEQVEFTGRIVHASRARERGIWGRVLAGLDLDAELAAIGVPTAVLAGTADKLTPIGHARHMAGLLPHCTGLTELPGLGHMTPLEDTPAVAAAIRRLVADHLAPAVGPAEGARSGREQITAPKVGTDPQALAREEEKSA